MYVPMVPISIRYMAWLATLVVPAKRWLTSFVGLWSRGRRVWTFVDIDTRKYSFPILSKCSQTQILPSTLVCCWNKKPFPVSETLSGKLDKTAVFVQHKYFICWFTVWHASCNIRTYPTLRFNNISVLPHNNRPECLLTLTNRPTCIC